MDDLSYQRWTDTLAEIRNVRRKSIDVEIQNKAESFSPSTFFDLVAGSLEQVMEKWFEYEKQSWDAQPPADAPAAIEQIRSEMESIVDFEVEAINRDMTDVQSHITWLPDSVTQAEPSYHTFVDELRKKFQIKVNGLAGGQKKRVAEAPQPALNVKYSGSAGGGGGLGLFAMFLVGLLLGGGPAFYFRDSAKKAERKSQEDRSKMISDQRVLSDSVTLIKDSFDQLATGKMKSLPALQSEIQKLESTYAEKKLSIEKTYLKERERAQKKMPAGNKLDAHLDKLLSEKEEAFERLDAQHKAQLQPIVIQRDKLKELLAN